jgi:polygalacturonase
VAAASNKVYSSLGAKYWDGKGTDGGVTKPHPMVKITQGGGSFSDVVSFKDK